MPVYPEKSCPFPGILYFATVERFTAAPRPGNAINIIVNTILDTFNFKPIQAAIIGHAFPAFAIFPLIHFLTPPLHIPAQELSFYPAALPTKGNNHI